jgi:biopolymer transport protein ExbD
MGMSSSSGDKRAVQSEINVTPLIDVLLVLLIIFLVVMPIMTKVETLQVPRKLEAGEVSETRPLTLKVRNDLSIGFSDGSSELDVSVRAVDVAAMLRPKLEAIHASTDKVVFVEFEDAVPWSEVIGTMDTIRSLATDVNRDEVKVALKVAEDKPEEGR